ncbi:DUF6232 family protein [Streptomyces sp. NPDC055092]
MNLRVSNKLLWIGGAAYPLHNITRVYTFMLRPRKKEAVNRFLTILAITLAVTLALTVLSALTAVASSDLAGGLLNLVWSCALAVIIYALVEMSKVLGAQSRFVMAVETSGMSTALVTSRNPEHLNQLVNYTAHAIDNPQAEFQVRVEALSVSPRHYHFGDNVNMYGGNGNVGITS